jgi:hypothetical protein
LKKIGYKVIGIDTIFGIYLSLFVKIAMGIVDGGGELLQ